ncbi:hypothetical protein B0I35DRAFT_473565 [Stachybotrys elegans]|uniref:Uncharacterized protein n=1 Tax=Stachybotrys elegans TaxID=80388 RepID=A0A8K0T2X7_9HYPO|nr:hypothetical protein B0I35DRAFT_473565 [Stachybotrys elegans]
MEGQCEAEDYVEFYVACNPVLLPRGVGHVIRTVSKALQLSDDVEILYEPDCGWLKCISPAGHKEKLISAIAETLSGLFEEETAPIDPDDETRQSTQADDVPSDILILGEEPHLARWVESNLAQADGVLLEDYNDYRFPQIFQGKKFRAQWRGLEEIGLSFSDFLIEMNRAISDAPANHEELEAELGCSISHNLNGDLLYLGTNPGLGVLDRAVSVLNDVSRLCMRPRGEADPVPWSSIVKKDLIDVFSESEEDFSEEDDLYNASPPSTVSYPAEAVPALDGEDLLWMGEGPPPMTLVAHGSESKSPNFLDDVESVAHAPTTSLPRTKEERHQEQPQERHQEQPQERQGLPGMGTSRRARRRRKTQKAILDAEEPERPKAKKEEFW